LKKNTTATKVLTSVEHKIKLIKELEKENNMKILDVEYNNVTCNVSDELFDKIQHTYSVRKWLRPETSNKRKMGLV
jgi:hypothetical protein